MDWESVPGKSAGAMNGDGSRKLLLHTTEGPTVEGAVAAYRANNSWPHLTVDCKRRRVVQHLPLGVAARSLRNMPGGADETNRDGTVLVQIEIVGTAVGPAIGDRDDLEWFGREVVGPVCRAQSIPVVSTVRWAPYPQSYGADAAQRLSVVAWDAYSGVLVHQHAPDNLHGDPGAIDIATILSAARGDDDMAWTQEDWDRMSRLVDGRLRDEVNLDVVTAAVVDRLNRDAFDKDGSPYRVETLRLARRGVNESLGAKLGDASTGLLKARLDAIEATLADIGSRVPPLPEPPAG